VQAQAFAVSTEESREAVTSYALAVADAINTGGEKATTAYAAAFSAAYAGVCHSVTVGCHMACKHCY
jgi:hypothetical protein